MTTSKKTHSAKAALAVALALLSGAPACIVHEPMSYPASPADLARVNAYADDHGLMRVVYEAVLPLCVGEACERDTSSGTRRRAVTVKATRIEPANESLVLIRHQDGGAEVQPLRALNSVHVRDRARGVLQGAGIGAAIGLGASVLVLEALYLMSKEDWGGDRPPVEFSCGRECVIGTATFTALSGAIGMVIGSIVGARRTFDFERLPEAPREP